MKSQKVTFQNHRNCSLRTSPKDSLFITFNNYSINFKGGLSNCRTGYCPYRAPCPGGEQFLWFLKNDLLWFHLIFFLFDSSKRNFLKMCLVRSIKIIANLCPIMIHFNDLDFNVCRSEEVISFLFDAQCTIFWNSLCAYTGSMVWTCG